MIKLPRFINGCSQCVAHPSVRSLERRRQVGRQLKLEGVVVKTRCKDGVISALALGCQTITRTYTLALSFLFLALSFLFLNSGIEYEKERSKNTRVESSQPWLLAVKQSRKRTQIPVALKVFFLNNYKALGEKKDKEFKVFQYQHTKKPTLPRCMNLPLPKRTIVVSK